MDLLLWNTALGASSSFPSSATASFFFFLARKEATFECLAWCAPWAWRGIEEDANGSAEGPTSLDLKEGEGDGDELRWLGKDWEEETSWPSFSWRQKAQIPPPPPPPPAW